MMLKKTIQIVVVLLLTIFSFYYTNKSIELIRMQDPIMKTIKNKESKYETKAINAIIKENTIIPGISGKVIDYDETYNKMKQYGAYNEVLTTLKEEKPAVSVEDYYDKYIISGNPAKKSVALIFKVEKRSPKQTIEILDSKQIKATFFIDGYYLENNYNEIATMTNHQLELLSYNSTYDKIYFSASKDYLETITKKPLKYCYCDYDNKEIINLCQSLNMHTVLPTIKVTSNPFQEVKSKLSNASIIVFSITDQTNSELSTILDYIKSRGYTLTTLTDLLNENIDK